MSCSNVIIYTDGSCLKNPGAGGCAFVAFFEKTLFFSSDYSNNTTNNQMEMLAAIKAMHFALERAYKNITLFTDSKYLRNGITSWIKNWKKNNWQTAAKTAVKNQEFWIELDLLNSKLDVDWQWVMAHSVNSRNNLVDSLANYTAKTQDIVAEHTMKSLCKKHNIHAELYEKI